MAEKESRTKAIKAAHDHSFAPCTNQTAHGINQCPADRLSPAHGCDCVEGNVLRAGLACGTACAWDDHLWLEQSAFQENALHEAGPWSMCADAD
jgi:hypothetical protein